LHHIAGLECFSDVGAAESPEAKSIYDVNYPDTRTLQQTYSATKSFHRLNNYKAEAGGHCLLHQAHFQMCLEPMAENLPEKTVKHKYTKSSGFQLLHIADSFVFGPKRSNTQ
jgi:hypothetical protein